MKAMILDKPGMQLHRVERADPSPGRGEVLVKVSACGVCRTDLHLVDGELPDPKLPVVPGHEIVGTVIGLGDGVDRFGEGERIGIPWLGRTCGQCRYCKSGDENLRRSPLHWLSDRRRICRYYCRRCALLLPDLRRLFGCGSCTPSVRRLNWI